MANNFSAAWKLPHGCSTWSFNVVFYLDFYIQKLLDSALTTHWVDRFAQKNQEKCENVKETWVVPIIWTSGTRSELWSTWSCDRCHVSPRYNENATLPWPLPPSPREPQRHELPPQVALPPAARRQVPPGQVLVSTTQILSLCKLSYVQTKLLVSGPVCTQSISNKPTLFPLNLFNRTRKHWHWIKLSKL